MPEVPTSIFDQVFIQETRVRRRKLMPKALKVYVWVFMVLPVLMLAATLYARWRFRAFTPELMSDLWYIINLVLAILFPIMRIAANLFIWLEKRWAILVALVVDFVFISFQAFSMYTLYASGVSNLSVVVITAFWLLIDIPYIIMLLKIKGSWEQKGYATNELSDIYVK
ncbi:MAG: hypothetical protein J7623_28995 [Chitinophaga sp.]|uniref:hypothetical protein n=1 Tax=Chitinophaga sp. TaxID=1869181 RepID=UPI001B0E70C7|nr:hypothetical protein [Chitinophaga sp.]MBO9732716.1 hypothetical protein [Chitinophaga sp.]